MRWTYLVMICVFLLFCGLMTSCANLSFQSDTEKVNIEKINPIVASNENTCELRDEINTNNLDALHRIVCLNVAID